LSVAGCVTPEMIASMAPNPVVFALANPEPEILPDQVRAVRDDAIIATGRSDYPNQVNNVLGFPFIFRGALDARAREVNEAMKMAATRALALLAKEDVPESVSRLYGLRSVKFGPDYLIPFPFDPRILLWVAPAVAWAAVTSGASTKFIDLKVGFEVHQQLVQIRGQIEQAKGRMRYFEQMTAFATINVELTPDAVATPAIEPGWQALAVVKDATRSLTNAGKSLATAAIWFVVYVVPILIFMALAIFITWKLLVALSKSSRRRLQS